jgi:uncharacterized protein (TIGR00266 family)
MEFRIDGNPDYGHLRVELRPGDRIVAEGGSMAWMSAGTKVKVRLLGGLFKALIRRLVANESLFVAEYSHPGIGMVTFSPATPGSVAHRRLDGDSFILTAGSYMASTAGVTLKTRFGGLRSLLSGEGAFLIECSGTGDLFYNAYGAMVEKEVSGSLTVDTGFVVAWEPGVSYSIRGMGNLKSTLLSGEGLAMNFSGSGKVFLQTRTLGGIAGWLTPFCSG